MEIAYLHAHYTGNHEKKQKIKMYWAAQSRAMNRNAFCGQVNRERKKKYQERLTQWRERVGESQGRFERTSEETYKQYKEKCQELKDILANKLEDLEHKASTSIEHHIPNEDCLWEMGGKCNKNYCTYNHTDLTKFCRFYQQGKCKFSDQECEYLHSSMEKVLRHRKWFKDSKQKAIGKYKDIKQKAFQHQQNKINYEKEKLNRTKSHRPDKPELLVGTNTTTEYKAARSTYNTYKNSNRPEDRKKINKLYGGFKTQEWEGML